MKLFTRITIVLLVFSQFQALGLACFWSNGFDMHIINYLPPNSVPLELHCQSKNDNFGHNILAPHQEKHWRFCDTIWGSTKYWCHFWWESKEKVFDVFDNYEWGKKCVKNSACYWLVQTDGFYFTNENSTASLTKVCDWDQRGAQMTKCGWA